MNTWYIIRKEVAENILSYRNVLTSFLCLVLLLASVFLLAHDYHERRVSYDQRDVLGQTRTGKRPKLAKPPTPLSTLGRGLDEHMGRLLFIWWGQPYKMETGAEVIDTDDANLLVSLFATPDFVYLVGTVLSLLALFFSCDAICGEKSRGTLRLLLANSVSRVSVLLGKWIGGLTSFLLCLLPAFLLALIYLLISPSVELSGDDWARIGLLFLLSLLYLSFIFSVGMFISTTTRHPSTSLLIILLVWVVWVVTMPNVGVLLAQHLDPVPEPQTIISAKREISSRNYDSTLDYFDACWAADDKYLARVNRQVEQAQDISRISPLACYTYAATALARTGIWESRRYKSSVVNWDRTLRRVGMSQGKGVYEWQEEIPYTYQEMSLSETLEFSRSDVLLLALGNVLFLIASLACFLRYDVR